jgi:hypothetical protein
MVQLNELRSRRLMAIKRLLAADVASEIILQASSWRSGVSLQAAWPMLFDNPSIHFWASPNGTRASLVGFWASSLAIEDALNGSWASLDEN